MDTWDEIDQIRAELERVNQSVERLTKRLHDVEATQKRDEARNFSAARSKSGPPPAPAAKEALPPPLPTSLGQYIATRVEPPEDLEVTVATPPAAMPIVPPLPIRPVAPPREKKPRRFGPPEGMGWEMAVATYWLPRLGILLLAAGTVWGFTFAANQWRDAAWMPYARVALGYTLALGLVGLGRWLEKKYAGYARVLMGGGFGLLYFVTFATWYIPQTRISPSQEFTLVLLGLLVVAWGAVAQWRKSQLLALSMALLGHFTVALSTLSLDTPSRAAVGGLLVLGIGSAWFLVRNGWYAVALSAMVGSYLNQFFWLQQSPSGGAPMDFAIGMTVLATYLVLYAVADRMTPVNFSGGHTRLRNVYCGLNTGGFLLLSLALLQGFAFTRGQEHWLYFATALFAGGMGWSYTTRERHADDHYTPAWTPAGNVRAAGANLRDPLSSFYFTKASALTTAGIGVWLDGPVVTLTIALQALTLLIAARQSGRPVGRLLSLGTAAIAFLHGWYTVIDHTPPAMGEAGFIGYAFVSLTSAAVFWAVAELYRVTPWNTLVTTPYAGPEMFRELCEGLEMSPEQNDAAPPPSRMIMAHALVAFGALLLVGNVDQLLPLYHAAPFMAMLALVATGLGLAQRSAPVLAGGAFFSAVGAFWWLDQLYGTYTSETNTLAMAAGCIVPLLVISELYRRLLPARFALHEQDDGIQGAWARNNALLSFIAVVVAALAIAAGLQERAEPAAAMLIAGILALSATGYAFAGTAANFGLLGVAMVMLTGVFSPQLDAGSFQAWMPLLGALLAGLAAVAGETRGWWGTCPGLSVHRLLPAPYLLYGAAAWNSVWLAIALAPESFVPIVICFAATAFALALPWLHARAMASLTTALAITALLTWMADSGRSDSDLWHHSCAIMVILALVGDRYFARHKPFTQPWPGRSLLVIAWIACMTYNDEVITGGWQYTGLALVGLGFLGYAAAFRTRTAAALSLFAGVAGAFPMILGVTHTMAIAPLWAGYISLIVYWLCVERGATIVLAHTGFKLDPGHEKGLSLLLTGIPSLLGVVCLSRIDAIQNFYLTMSWTAWGLVIFCWALFTRQPWFRYMGLATFALALARAFFVDVWRLEGLYRVGAMLFLGAALLAVAYGYTRWRAGQEEEERRKSS